MLTPEEIQQIRDKNRTINLNTPTNSEPQLDSWDIFNERAKKNIATKSLIKDQVEQKKGSLFKNIGLAITSSERALGRTFGGALATGSKEVKAAQESQVGLDEMSQKLVEKIKEVEARGGDSSRLREQLQRNQGQDFDIATVIPETQKTGKQIAGEALGVGLDIVTAGTVAKGATSFKLFGNAQKAAEAAKKVKEGASIAQVIAQNIEGTYKVTTGKKLLDVGVKTGKNVLEGATLGYGYDVSQGLQAGMELPEALRPGVGMAVGAAIPFGLGAKKAGGIIAKAEAPRVINSLIKPLMKDFSYGKNPGRAVAEEGIVANSLDDLAQKITASRQKTGQAIGELNQKLQGKAQLSVESALEPINAAMNEAAKTNNKTLLNRLQAVKEAITENLAVGADDLGNPTIVSEGRKNLRGLEFDEAFQMKRDIGDMTQWTGNVSDDKAVNSALKQAYGKIKEEINTKAAMVDRTTAQELARLNEKYADLTSAEVAAKYRDKITQRQNVLSLGNKLGTVAGVTAALMSGQGLSLTTILAGATGAILDKALGSTAVKTRFAKMLAGEAPGAIERIINTNPKVRDAIYGAFDTDIKGDVKTLLQKVNGFLKSKGGLQIEDVTREAMDAQRDVLMTSLSKYKNKITDAVSKKRITMEESVFLTDELPKLIERKTDNPEILRSAIETLKRAGIDIADEMKTIPRLKSSPAVGQTATKYKTTINIQDKNDLEYLGRILSEDNIKDIQAGKMTNFRGTPYEDLARVNIISKTPQTIEQQLTGKIKDVKLKSDTFYHGTSAENAKGIMESGFKRGSDLPKETFRGGGYGKMQSSISLTETPKDASRFSTLTKNGEIVEVKLKPNSKVVSIQGVEDALDLEDYIAYLRKQKIDAVYIGGGEKELVIINPKAIIPTKSQLTDIWNKANKATAEQSLIQEAKKYKTAEEFVKAQGTPVYHGTASDFEMFDPKFKGYSTDAESAKGAFWFTDDEATARAYAVYAAEDAPVQRLLKQAETAEKIAKKTGKESDWVKYDKLVAESEKLAEYDATFLRRQKYANVKEAYLKGDFLEIDAKGKTPQELSSDDNIDSWLNSKIKEAIKKNKAGLKIINIDDAVGLYDKPSTHYAVFNAEQIKTKSQLTDIWNKANKVK